MGHEMVNRPMRGLTVTPFNGNDVELRFSVPLCRR